MKVAVDIDGTADSDPKVFGDLMASLRKAGHKVIILSGCHQDPVTKDDVKGKEDYLNRLGLGSSYDKLRVFPDPPGPAKAAWCKKHDVSILIDNSMMNAQLASDTCTVLVPWKSLTA